MLKTIAFALLGLALCTTATCGPARADTLDRPITPAKLCAVQHAIQFQSPRWTPAKCESVAVAISLTTSPLDLLSICINESDLRERAIAWHGPDVADVGLCGIRCLLGPDRRCTNGAAAGLTVRQLQHAETNLAIAAAHLVARGGVHKYQSRTPHVGRAYASRIAVLTAALSGAPVERKRIKGLRLRKLAAQIRAALNHAHGRNS